jgi:hypothetical protein
VKERCSVLEEKFRQRPRFGLADEAYQVMQDEPFEQWSWLSVMGLYLSLWQEKFHGHTWRGRPLELRREVMGLIDKLSGTRPAVEGLKAVFSKDLAWVKSDQLSFLLNPNTYTKYVVPVVAAQRKSHGEQSEWAGERSAERKAKKVRL